MLNQLLLVLSAAAAAYANPALWSKLGRAQANDVLEFSVAMPSSNLDELDRVFWAVSTPGSPQYGKFLSMEEIRQLTATPKNVVSEVLSFVEAGGRTSCKVFSDSLRCRSTVAAVEELIQTELYTFQHKKNGDVIKRVPLDGSYSFPKSMEGKIKFMTGLIGFPVERYGRTRLHSEVPLADYSIVPETLQDIYNMKGAKGAAASIQAATEFQDYPAYADDDLTKFIANTAVPTFSVVKHIGPFDQSNPQPESSLDVEYLGAVGVANTNWYWTEADWLYEFSVAVVNSNSSSLPMIFSMSYGWSEAAQCQISPGVAPCKDGGSLLFVQTVNTNFQKIGTNGVTLIAASGDSGSHGRTDITCQSEKTFPDYPAASPYVLAVGGTQLQNGVSSGATSPICKSTLQCATGGTEIVASTATGALITSGGGFSNVAATQSYQTAAVAKYLASGALLPPAADFNKTGRGYPDVAALAHNYYIQMAGQVYAVDGTSCSCPVFAGIVSNLNAARLTAGKPQLGFVNPLIYQIATSTPSAFHDITSGDNKCTEEQCCTTGFGATTGWDAVSGWGTPNYGNLLAAVNALDKEIFGF